MADITNMVQIILIILFIPSTALLFFVQYKLCTGKNYKLGLIIPTCLLVASILFFTLISAILLLSVAVKDTEITTIYDEHGNIIKEEVINDTENSNAASVVAGPLLLLILFVITNIPTVVMYIMYFYFKKNGPRNKEIDKMNIADLE